VPAAKSSSSHNWGSAGSSPQFPDPMTPASLTADIMALQRAAHASEQFVRSEGFYEIANHVGLRMSAVRQQTWLSRLDFSRLGARGTAPQSSPRAPAVDTA
jgi:hypothetical protein